MIWLVGVSTGLQFGAPLWPRPGVFDGMAEVAFAPAFGLRLDAGGRKPTLATNPEPWGTFQTGMEPGWPVAFPDPAQDLAWTSLTLRFAPVRGHVLLGGQPHDVAFDLGLGGGVSHVRPYDWDGTAQGPLPSLWSPTVDLGGGLRLALMPHLSATVDLDVSTISFPYYLSEWGEPIRTRAMLGLAFTAGKQ